jgi:hypothetical protein
MGMSFDAASETDGRWQGFRFALATEMRPLPMRSAPRVTVELLTGVQLLANYGVFDNVILSAIVA